MRRRPKATGRLSQWWHRRHQLGEGSVLSRGALLVSLNSAGVHDGTQRQRCSPRAMEYEHDRLSVVFIGLGTVEEPGWVSRSPNKLRIEAMRSLPCKASWVKALGFL